jgi:TolB-like protein
MAKRFAFGPFLLDAARGTLTRDGTALAVGQRGLRILQALLDADGAVVPKDALMALAWPKLVVEDSNLSVQIATLRKLLGVTATGADWIVTAPRMGYRLAGDSLVEDGALEPMAHGAADPSGRPTIAVLPFTNLSNETAQDYFVDGVTEDIIAALTRFRWFAVIGRNASHVYKVKPTDATIAARELGARYLVEGSVRKLGQRVRISAALVDAVGDHCLWADHYDHDFGTPDAFDVQDTIAQQVAGTIEPELLKEVGGLAVRRRSGSVTGWDLVVQGCWFFHHVTKPTHLRARELFRQACLIDPELTEARLWPMAGAKTRPKTCEKVWPQPCRQCRWTRKTPTRITRWPS